MTLMAWSPHFETGLELVDTQHHALVDMVNIAAPHLALNDAFAKQAVGPLLDNLTRYAAIHFRDEERLMSQHQLDPAYRQHHHQSHQAFVDELTLMRRQYAQEGSLSGAELLRFLGSWLSFHILVEDQRMADQLNDMAAGMSAQQAAQRVNQPQDAAHAVYNKSLLDMFTLLTERNHKLALTNQEVQRVKTALELSNQSLEARVQERTRDLAASVASLEQAQNRLLQSEKMAAVGQLAAGVAHEINNPVGFVNSNLGSLDGYVQQLFGLLAAYEKAAVFLPVAQRSALDQMRQQVDLAFLREDIPGLINESREGLARVKRIVNDLRECSELESAPWVWADLSQLLESALTVAMDNIGPKTTVVRVLTELPPVQCMVSQLTQALVKVLLNAAQAITTDGRITVRSGTAGDRVWLQISDTGCGMSEEVQKRIFEPFYTTGPVGKGTGLGLSVAWEIIKHHQGQIDVTSAPAQGSTFRITLPQHQTIKSAGLPIQPESTLCLNQPS